MKVCFVIQKLVGLTGGSERILCEVASAMDARGMDVSIFTYDTLAGQPSYPLAGGVRHRNLFPFPRPAPQTTLGSRKAEHWIKSIPDIWPLPLLKWQVSYAPFIRALARKLKIERPDVVVGFMPTGIMAATLAATPLGIPTVASTHNVPEQDYGDTGRWDPNPLYRSRRWEALSQAAHILVLQDSFADWFISELTQKISTMPNPIAPAAVPLLADRKPIILGVGRLTQIKRWNRLITAFAKIAPAHPDWRLRIYGEGPERANLTALVKAYQMQGRITLPGVTDQIMSIYAESAFLCHPAAFEGFGLSVGEALAHGLPVIADAACPGVNTLVEHGRTGLLIDTDTTLSEALNHMINDRAQRTAMSVSAPSSMDRFAPGVVFERWQRLLTSCQSPPSLV